ncbi:MAG: DinB family protein [Candidatus Heimdallarchaeaceae archaeon]
MYRLVDLYDSTVKERNNFFLLFEQMDEEVWHAKLEKELWSPENTFRHLLSSIAWIQNYLEDVKLEESPLALKYGTQPEGKYSIQEMKEAFEKVNSVLKPAIEKLAPDDEDFEIESSFGKNTRAKLIAGFLTHEHGHFGQITYTIKRFTGKSDQDLRELLFGALKKEKEE